MYIERIVWIIMRSVIKKLSLSMPLYLLKFFWNLLAAVNNCFMVVFFFCTLLWGPWHSRSSLPGLYSFTSSSNLSNVFSFPPNLEITWLIEILGKGLFERSLLIPLLLLFNFPPTRRYNRRRYRSKERAKSLQIATSCSEEIPSTLSKINQTSWVRNINYFFLSSNDRKIGSSGPLNCNKKK